MFGFEATVGISESDIHGRDARQHLVPTFIHRLSVYCPKYGVGEIKITNIVLF